MTGSPRPVGVRARPMVVGVAVAVIGAAGWFIVGPGAAPPAGACTVPAELPVSSSRPPPIAESTAVRWSAAELPAPIRNAKEQTMLDVAAFRGAFVAVGRESDGPHWHAFFLRSTDGVHWDGNPTDAGQFAGAEIGSLAVAGDRLFGIGSVSTNDRGGSRGAVWYSDDGRTWREATGEFHETYLTALSSGDDGLLMLGTVNSSRRAVAWTSASGEAWTAEALELPVPAENAQFVGLAALGGGWLAAGSVSRGVDSPTAAIMWRSTDGRSWTCDHLDGAGYAVAQPMTLYQSNTSWLAVGTAANVCGFGASCPGYTTAWASDNGLRWTRAMTQGAPLEAGGTAFAGSQRGYLAVGHGATWVSADGMRWTLAIDGGTGDVVVGQADALVMTDDGRVVAVGTVFDNLADADPWIGFGELSRGN